MPDRAAIQAEPGDNDIRRVLPGESRVGEVQARARRIRGVIGGDVAIRECERRGCAARPRRHRDRPVGREREAERLAAPVRRRGRRIRRDGRDRDRRCESDVVAVAAVVADDE